MSKNRTAVDVLAELSPLLPLARVVARWVFTGVALHGYLVGRERDAQPMLWSRDVIRGCVRYADDLIAELETPKGGDA